MGRLQGKVALITGGSKGIGKAIVERFAEEGAKVVFTAIEKEAGDALEKELIPDRLIFMQQDVSKKDDWNRIINATLNKFGKINIIVNNAGIGVFSDIEKMTEKNWDATIGVNLTGTMWGVKYGIQAMKNNHEKMLRLGHYV